MNNDKRINTIIQIAEQSERIRETIVQQYLSNYATPEKPYYLVNENLTSSHLSRMKESLKMRDSCREESYRAYNVKSIAGTELKIKGGFLAEISIMIIQEILEVKGDLHVAGGFFSFMVSCIDDYLDKEDNYHLYGEKLIQLSHVYHDLVYVSLEREVEVGNINACQFLKIKNCLFDVSKTLVKSESTRDPDRYLYEKSCGDKVIGVLFPASQSSLEVQVKCAELGRLVGEVGQLIDDIMDYDNDLMRGGKNYLLMSNRTVQQTIEEVKNRLMIGRKIVDELGSDSALWILDVLEDIVSVFERKDNQHEKIIPSLLQSSIPLPFLKSEGIHDIDLLLWF
jgi:hypothetical protein